MTGRFSSADPQRVDYHEIRGKLVASAATTGKSVPAPVVVLSSLSHGAAQSPAWDGLSVRYVASGTEVYRIAGRTYRLREGELMVAPQALAGEVEIPRRAGRETLGICLFYPASRLGDDGGDTLAMPMVTGASASSLGKHVARQLARLVRDPLQPVDARSLLHRARPQVIEFAKEIERHVRAVGGVREATRYDAVRRAHAARSHLHDTLHRPVPLAELAEVANLSSFQLARTFADCFGVSPGRYHRRLRLDAVRQEVLRTGQSWQQACERFGFTSGSGFAHAWRRAFGGSPRSGATP